MDRYRLRIKVGAAEFEAEGPEDIVHRDYEEWKGLIDQVPASTATVEHNGTATGQAPSAVIPPATVSGNGKGKGLDAQELQGLFSRDEAHNIVSLKYLPQGDDRVPIAMLLLLLGYRKLVESEEVPVTQLKTALGQSGLNVERVDRDAAGLLIKEQWVLKGGKAKGGRYKLTNTGMAKAESEARKLLQQI